MIESMDVLSVFSTVHFKFDIHCASACILNLTKQKPVKYSVKIICLTIFTVMLLSFDLYLQYLKTCN